MERVLMAMSGGVDSSVAAYLLKKQGYECIGVHMKLYRRPEDKDKSINDRDTRDARDVCEKLGIEFKVYDFSEQFDRDVIEKWVRIYESGATPNPCVYCNKHIKFGRLMELADELDCKYVASGHYAQIIKDGDQYIIKKAKDSHKDQSYVLYQFDQDLLGRTLMPLGEYSKDQIREIAEELGLSVAEKEESQDICFVENGNYVDFIENYRGEKFPEGQLLDPEGKVLGKHKGAISYTIGQRKGLGLAMPYPVYVLDKNMTNNTVIVGRNENLFSEGLIVDDFKLISGKPLDGPLSCQGKIRYNAQAADCTLYPLGEEGKKIKVIFKKNQRAIAKGQAFVVYNYDVLLGGGTILRAGVK